MEGASNDITGHNLSNDWIWAKMILFVKTPVSRVPDAMLETDRTPIPCQCTPFGGCIRGMGRSRGRRRCLLRCLFPRPLRKTRLPIVSPQAIEKVPDSVSWFIVAVFSVPRSQQLGCQKCFHAFGSDLLMHSLHASIFSFVGEKNLRNQLDDATGLRDLLLRQLADPSRADDQGDFGQAALAEDLRVAEGQEVEDRDGVLLLAGDVGLTGLGRDEGPQLESQSVHVGSSKCFSANAMAECNSRMRRVERHRRRGPSCPTSPVASSNRLDHRSREFGGICMYLVQVDDGLPEVVLLLVEVPHTNLTEVTRVVLFRQSQPSSFLDLVCSSFARTLSMLVRWWC